MTDLINSKAILLLKPAGFDVSEFEKVCEVERKAIGDALKRATVMQGVRS